MLPVKNAQAHLSPATGTVKRQTGSQRDNCRPVNRVIPCLPNSPMKSLGLMLWPWWAFNMFSHFFFLLFLIDLLLLARITHTRRATLGICRPIFRLPLKCIEPGSVHKCYIIAKSLTRPLEHLASSQLFPLIFWRLFFFLFLFFDNLLALDCNDINHFFGTLFNATWR